MWAFKTCWTHRYIENMLFWSHTDRGLKAPEKHNCSSSSFSTQRRKSVGNFLSFFKCVGVHVGNFLLWGHEAKADTLHLARLSQHGQFNALYYYCIGFPLEYIRYTQVGGRGMLAMHRDTHTHTRQTPKRSCPICRLSWAFGAGKTGLLPRTTPRL